MTDTPSWTTDLNSALAPAAMFVRGGFHPNADDTAAMMASGQQAGTVVLVGNAGNALWKAFQDSAPDMAARHPLNTWVATWLSRAAHTVGAEIIDPMKPPYPPIQDWARRADSAFRSPINLVIHPTYGLWHTYRGALLFDERLPLPSPQAMDSPCDTCARKPCLTACPATAFIIPAGEIYADFSPNKCVDHVDSPKGGACQSVGCLARRACPVGRDWAYDREPAAYHMAAVVKTVRAWQARGWPDELADKVTRKPAK